MIQIFTTVFPSSFWGHILTLKSALNSTVNFISSWCIVVQEGGCIPHLKVTTLVLTTNNLIKDPLRATPHKFCSNWLSKNKNKKISTKVKMQHMWHMSVKSHMWYMHDMHVSHIYYFPHMCHMRGYTYVSHACVTGVSFHMGLTCVDRITQIPYF